MKVIRRRSKPPESKPAPKSVPTVEAPLRRGWDGSLREQVREEFRTHGARVFREERDT